MNLMRYKAKLSKGIYDPQNICEVVDEIVRIGSSIGVNFLGYTTLSLSQFSVLSVTVQSTILSQLQEYINTINIIDPALPKHQNETRMLKKVCKSLGISIPEDFISSIKGDEIIEIYRLGEDIQIYRNLEFMKYSTYDFTTVLTHSLPELFQRPDEVHAMLAERANVVATTATGSQPWGLPKHILIERLHPQLNAFEMDMLNIAPGIDQATNTRAFWVSTLKVRPIGSAYQGSRNIRPL